jgi:hypothetical protein
MDMCLTQQYTVKSRFTFFGPFFVMKLQFAIIKFKICFCIMFEKLHFKYTKL